MTRRYEARSLACSLENLVRAQCLEPVDVARVVGPLVEALGGMSVKNRAAERGAFDRVAVAPCGAVPARQDELELSAARLAEDRDGVGGETTRVLLHVV